MLRSLLPFLLALMAGAASSIVAAPTPAEIAAALDDPEGGWSISGASVEVVAMPGAVGGTALKLEIPKEQFLYLTRVGGGEWLISRLQFLVDDISLELRSRNHFGSPLPIAEATPGQWEATQWVESIFSGEFGWEMSADYEYLEENRVIYLDGVETAAGVLLQPECVGCSIGVSPSKPYYDPEEFVELTATPDSMHDLILRWTRPSSSGASARVVARAEDAREYAALAARRLEIGAVEVTIPATASVELPAAGGAARVEPKDGATVEILLRVPEPGFISFHARAAAPGANSRIGTWQLSDGMREIGFWTSGGTGQIPLPIEGAVELQGLAFAPGHPVVANVFGEGSVAGLPSDGRAQTGRALSLVASPAEGWKFGGWKGDRLASGPTLDLEVQGPVALEAWFYEDFDFEGQSLGRAGDAGWTVDASGESPALVAPNPAPANWEGALVWTFDGPGLFSFEYQGSALVKLDERAVAELPQVYSVQPPQTFSVMVPLGRHEVSIVAANTSDYERTLEARLGDFSWASGYPASARAQAGGRVEGAPADGSFVPPGTVLELKAMADAGAAFSHWTDASRSTDPELTIEVWEPLDIAAVFVAAPDAESWVEALSGDKLWTRAGDAWSAPGGMEPGQSSTIARSVEGPCRLVFDVSSAGIHAASLRYGWDGAIAGVLQLGAQSIDAPAGRRMFFIEYVRPDGETEPAYSVSNFETRYQVTLEAPFGEITTQPALPFTYSDPLDPSGKPAWRGYLPAGATLDYSASSAAMEFQSWTGDLAGSEAEGSIVVDGNLRAKAEFGKSAHSFSGDIWQITPPDAAYAALYDPAVGAKPGRGVTLSREISGPATLHVFYRGNVAARFTIDGQEAEPLSANSSVARLYVPEGARRVTITVPAQSGIDDSAPSFVQRGIWDIARLPGYPVDQIATWGGDVMVQPDDDASPPGSAFAISAEAWEGNEFVGWEPPLEGRPASFTLTPDGLVTAQARFRPIGQIDGLDWDYAGALPHAYLPSTDSNFPRGSFLYRVTIPPGDFESAMAATILTGPGELVAPRELEFWEGEFEIALLVDGVAHTLAESDVGIPIGPGEHEVAWSIVAVGDQPAQGTFELGVPFVRASFDVRVMAWDEEIAISPELDLYLHGETVTLAAPATDAHGAEFAGWWSGELPWSPGEGPDGTFLSAANPYVFDVVSQRPIFALYGKLPSDSPGLLVTAPGAQTWAMSAEASPAGGSSYESNDARGDLVVTALADSYVSFYVKAERANAMASVDTAGVVAWPRDATTWRRISIWLRAGESLEIDPGHDSGKTYVGGIQAQPGWGPSIVHPPLGSIEPADFAGLSVGETVMLRPDAASAGAFVGWIVNRNAFEAGTERAVAVGDRNVLEPVFAGIVDTPIGTAEADFAFGWILDAPSNRLVSDLPWLDEPYSELRWAVEGPCVLLANLGATFVAMIDGVEQSWAEASGSYSSQRYIQIPAGARELALRNYPSLNVPNDIYDLELIPGYAAPRSNTSGGIVHRFPDRLVYAPGETVTFWASPNDGWRFDGWDGSFVGNAAQFTTTVGGELAVRPRFRPRETSFKAWNMTWKSFGLGRIEQSLEDHRGDGSEFSETTTVSGGALLDSWIETEMDEARVLLAPRHLSASIDGVSIRDDKHVSEVADAERIRIGIPTGSAFRIAVASGDTTLDSSMRFDPGCLLVARGAGLQLKVSPEMHVYTAGTEVTVEVLDPLAPDQIEWIGLPADAEIEGRAATFAISRHTRVEALRWEAVNLFGIKLRHAGNHDWQARPIGGYALSGLSDRESDYLSLALPQSVRLRYQLRPTDDNPLLPAALSLARNGASTSLGTTAGSDGDGVIAGIGSSDDIRFRVSAKASYHAANQEVAELALLELLDAPTNPYLGWWLRYHPHAEPTEQDLRPATDADRDGWPNYLEYLLNTNPSSPDLALQIEATDARGGFALLRPVLPENAPGAMTLLRTSILKGGWSPADDHLHPAETIPGVPLWLRQELKEAPSPDDPEYFRVRYDGELPTLDELLAD